MKQIAPLYNTLKLDSDKGPFLMIHANIHRSAPFEPPIKNLSSQTPAGFESQQHLFHSDISQPAAP
jgi:hypothetical protein